MCWYKKQKDLILYCYITYKSTVLKSLYYWSRFAFILDYDYFLKDAWVLSANFVKYKDDEFGMQNCFWPARRSVQNANFMLFNCSRFAHVFVSNSVRVHSREFWPKLNNCAFFQILHTHSSNTKKLNMWYVFM